MGANTQEIRFNASHGVPFNMGPVIRVVTEQDAEEVAGIYEPIVAETHISFESTPPSPPEIADRIQSTLVEYPWLVCEYNERVTGYAYAGAHKERDAYQWGVDVSVYVAEDYRGHGVARGLYASLLELLRKQGFYTAYAVIALPNPASVGLHESLGFTQVGVYEKAGYKQGEWRDVGHWERVLQSHSESPVPPVPFSEVLESDDLNGLLAHGEASISL